MGFNQGDLWDLQSDQTLLAQVINQDVVICLYFVLGQDFA